MTTQEIKKLAPVEADTAKKTKRDSFPAGYDVTATGPGYQLAVSPITGVRMIGIFGDGIYILS